MTLFQAKRGSLRGWISDWTGVLLLATALLLLSGCAETGTMATQPKYNPLSSSSFFKDGSSARPSVDGAVPYTGDQSPNDPIQTGITENGEPFQGFPEPVTKELVALGQERYNIYCTPCHGTSGKGDGKVISFGFSKPPDLLGDTVKGLANGDIFMVITDGKGKMFSYGYRVKPEERWAVIAYIRAMQLKNGSVNPADLTPAELSQLGKQP